MIDVQKYIDYFTLPASMGGVKADPRDVILTSIAPPPEPVSVSLFQCSSDPTPRCPWENPSCGAWGMGPWGNPTVRLTPVVQSAATSQLTSLCDFSFQSALQSIGQMIVARVE